MLDIRPFLPTGETLEREIVRTIVSKGRRVPNQIAIDINYPLSAFPEADKEFFKALDRLEEKGIIEWYPARERIPLAHEPEDRYEGRVYRIKTCG